jgi:TorA maturation chaperone TorD
MTAEASVLRATDEEVALALRRAGLYRLLGAAFAYPGPERCAEVGRLASAIAESVPGDARLAGALAALVAAARDAVPSAVAAEYVFLFDREVRCSPHEGSYGDRPQLAGKSALLADVSGFYTAFGLEPSAGEPDVEDHVAAELEFMSALAVKEAWALAQGEAEGFAVTRRAQAAFLTDHLGRWAGVFAEELATATPLPYYTTAAALLCAWIDAECERLGAAPTRIAQRLGHDPQEAEAFTCPMAESEGETV